MMRFTEALLVPLLALCAACHRSNEPVVTLTIESWRTDDMDAWQSRIIPAFEATHPGIHVKFSPTSPKEYNAALNAKLDGGVAGEIITCRAFDATLALYRKGQLEPVDSLPGMNAFDVAARTPWATDDQKTTICVPVGSVIHGFIYNRNAFEALGLTVPTTEAEFFTVLEKLKSDGRYTALDLGTAEQWEAAAMGYQNIGPTYWGGERGRLALIHGSQKLTDPQWVEPFRVLARWRPYLPEGYQSQTNSDSQTLFTLGRAAIYPAGSFELPVLTHDAKFALGAFPPPVKTAGDRCQITDHPDLAIGLNAHAKHPAEARQFLTWIASPEFAQVYADALPSLFPLSNYPVVFHDPVAREFLAWRARCSSTIRSTYQFLSRGTPNLETETWVASANVLNGTETPEAAAARLQKGLDHWYQPPP